MEIIFHSYEILIYSQFLPLKTKLNQLKTWDPPLAADSDLQHVLVRYLLLAGEAGLGGHWRSLPAQLACDSDKTD